MKLSRKLWVLFERIVRTLCYAICDLLTLEITEQKWNGFMQFVKFCVIGASNTLISLCIYYLFVWFDEGLYLFGNIVGFIVGVLNSYIWNNRFVFRKKAQARTLVKTFVAYGISLLLGTGTLFILVDIAGMSQYIAPLLVVLVTTPVNFIMNKLWAYGGKHVR